jgi:hypothetical protein
MAPIVVMMAPRPDVKVEAWPIAVVVVVAWAMPVPAVPVAAVSHLLDACAFTATNFEISCYAAYRCGLSRRRETKCKRGHHGCEEATACHSSTSFISRRRQSPVS